MPTADFRLLKPHKINRREFPAGELVTLPTQLGDWLVDQGVAERTGGRDAEPLPRATARGEAPRRFAAPNFSRRSCCNWPSR